MAFNAVGLKVRVPGTRKTMYQSVPVANYLKIESVFTYSIKTIYFMRDPAGRNPVEIVTTWPSGLRRWI